MRLATIICTYNRAQSLRRTLETLARAELPADAQWEVIVVDNRSTDNTEAVCREFEGKLPIHYCVEPHPGKSSALNTGIRLAKADLLLFTDDDVDVDRLWIKSFADAAARMQETPFFAGRIFAQLQGSPPRWFADHAQTILSGVALHFDRGESECDMETAIGANMALRAEVFATGRSFRPDLGPDGTETVRSEEDQLFEDLRAAVGERRAMGRYVPSALVFHRTSAKRTTETYVRRWFYGDGVARVRRNQVDPGTMLFKAPRYLWRKLITSAVSYMLLRPFAPSRLWLKQEIEMASTLGIIHEWRRMKKQEALAQRAMPCT